MQSYAVDKRLTVADLRYERVDVIAGAALVAGMMGTLFVVVACAETLHAHDLHIEGTACSDAAAALAPLAGEMASTFFAVGLIGAAPHLRRRPSCRCRQAYSVCDLTGSQAALDSSFSEAQTLLHQRHP